MRSHEWKKAFNYITKSSFLYRGDYIKGQWTYTVVVSSLTFWRKKKSVPKTKLKEIISYLKIPIKNLSSSKKINQRQDKIHRTPFFSEVSRAFRSNLKAVFKNNSNLPDDIDTDARFFSIKIVKFNCCMGRREAKENVLLLKWSQFNFPNLSNIGILKISFQLFSEIYV